MILTILCWCPFSPASCRLDIPTATTSSLTELLLTQWAAVNSTRELIITDPHMCLVISRRLCRVAMNGVAAVLVGWPPRINGFTGGPDSAEMNGDESQRNTLEYYLKFISPLRPTIRLIIARIDSRIFFSPDEADEDHSSILPFNCLNVFPLSFL